PCCAFAQPLICDPVVRREGMPDPSPITRYREITAARRDEMLAKGFKRRDFFPHRFHVLPKCGPDGALLARRMCGAADPSGCREIILFADREVTREFPDHIFFDDDLLWHQQHFG